MPRCGKRRLKVVVGRDCMDAGRSPNLEADIAHDAGFLEALQEDDFANAAYEVLKTECFYRGELRGWNAGYVAAAVLVANLRGLGESFSDWDPWGGSRDELYLQSVHEHLARIGWRIKI